MAYRAKAKSIAQAVTRSLRYGENVRPSPLSGEACWNTKINRRTRYVEAAEFEEYKHIRAMIGLYGNARAAVIAGRYERASTW